MLRGSIRWSTSVRFSWARFEVGPVASTCTFLQRFSSEWCLVYETLKAISWRRGRMDREAYLSPY